MLQLAERVLDDRKAVAVVVPLPEWASRSLDLFAFLAAKQAFWQRGVTAAHLRILARDGRLSLLLDGWNELGPDDADRAGLAVETLRRELPHLGLIVGTRAGAGPSAAAALFRLERLTEALREDLVRRALGAEAGESAINDIRRSPELDEITRTPLYLAAFLAALASERGSEPVTRDGLLRALVARHERDAKSGATFRAILQPQPATYLAAIGVKALTAGGTAIGPAVARRTVSEAAETLLRDGQIGAQPEPQAVLDALVARHLLVCGGGDEPIYTFPHQEFRDWYASFSVERALRDIAGDAAARNWLLAEVADSPAWERALLFAAERTSRSGDDGAAAVAELVVRALGVDPMLAAVIIRRSGEASWSLIAPQVSAFARRWHRPNEADRALRFALATGRPEFADLIWPFLASDDQQTRLEALRLARGFALTPRSLGVDARAQVLALPDDARTETLMELALSGGPDALDFATDLAIESGSFTAKAAVAQALDFHGARPQLERVAASFADAEWDAIAARRIDFGSVGGSGTVAARFREALRRRAATAPPGVERAAALLALVETLDAPMGDVLAEIGSAAFDADSGRAGSVVQSAARLDPAGVAVALRRRLIEDLPLPQGGEELVRGPVRAADRARLVAHLLGGELRWASKRATAALLEADDAAALLDSLLTVADALIDPVGPAAEPLRER